MVAKKDYHAMKHPDLGETIPNLEVIKTMQVFYKIILYRRTNKFLNIMVLATKI